MLSMQIVITCDDCLEAAEPVVVEVLEIRGNIPFISDPGPPVGWKEIGSRRRTVCPACAVRAEDP